MPVYKCLHNLLNVLVQIANKMGLQKEHYNIPHVGMSRDRQVKILVTLLASVHFSSTLKPTPRATKSHQSILRLKNAIFLDVLPCSSYKNGRFGGTYHHHQGKNRRARNCFRSNSQRKNTAKEHYVGACFGS
jgi:hypothetical protein